MLHYDGKTCNSFAVQIKNGAGQFEMGHRKFTHVFDGFGKLYSWNLESPDRTMASFSTKFIRSLFYNASLSSGEIATYLLFEMPDPPYDLLERTEAMLRGTDNMNINVLQLGSTDKCFLAVSDFWQSYKFHPFTLDVISRVDDDLPLNNVWSRLRLLPIPSTSHPVPENPDLSSYISFYSLLSPLSGLFGGSVNVIRISSEDEQRELIASIPMDPVPYMHCLGLSRNYAILFAHPLFLDFYWMLRTADPSRSLNWEPEHGMDIYLVHLTDRTVIKVTTEADFITHHINAYEDKTLLYVDMIAYPNPDLFKNLHVDILLNSEIRDAINVNNVIKRYIIDLIAKTVTVTTFDLTHDLQFINHLDMPVINERFRRSSYCYAYGNVVKSDGIRYANTTLVKKELCGRNGEDLAWHAPNHYPSEPWFIERPKATREDDGVLLSVVLDGEERRSYLAVFNATTLQMMSRSYLPTVVPFTLHGRHFDVSDDANGK